MRAKDVKNMDDVFKKLNTLAKNGTLELWRKKYGKKYGMGLTENTSINNKIESLLENVVATSVGAPVASFGGGTTQIKDSYAKPVLHTEGKTHQDPGAKTKR
jgi:hypothetical protein